LDNCQPDLATGGRSGIKAFLVDDKPLALERLRRMLHATGRVEIAGASTDPVDALDQIRALTPGLLFS